MTLYTNLLNQVFEIEQKLQVKGDSAEVARNIDRIKNILDEAGYSYHSPLHEKYTDTRTDCEANIVGNLVDGSMVISKVIKPIVFYKEGSASRVIVQKAVVLVEHKK